MTHRRRQQRKLGGKLSPLNRWTIDQPATIETDPVQTNRVLRWHDSLAPADQNLAFTQTTLSLQPRIDGSDLNGTQTIDGLARDSSMVLPGVIGGEFTIAIAFRYAHPNLAGRVFGSTPNFFQDLSASSGGGPLNMSSGANIMSHARVTNWTVAVMEFGGNSAPSYFWLGDDVTSINMAGFLPSTAVSILSSTNGLSRGPVELAEVARYENGNAEQIKDLMREYWSI